MTTIAKKEMKHIIREIAYQALLNANAREQVAEVLDINDEVLLEVEKYLDAKLNPVEESEKKSPVVSKEEILIQKLEENPETCPHCNSENIKASKPEVDDSDTWHNATCNDCNQQWREF